MGFKLDSRINLWTKRGVRGFTSQDRNPEAAAPSCPHSADRSLDSSTFTTTSVSRTHSELSSGNFAPDPVLTEALGQ